MRGSNAACGARGGSAGRPPGGGATPGDGRECSPGALPVVRGKGNQALATLDKFRTRLDQVSTRLTALEFEGGTTLHDVLTVLQRSELVTRMAVEIERYIVELGSEGRLIEMQ